MIQSEQIQAIIAFTLGKHYLACFVILQNIAFVVFSISIGCAYACSISVGLYIGQKQVYKIKIVLLIALLFSNSLIVILNLLLIIFRREIISSFINDNFIIENTLSSLIPFCIFLIFQVNNYLLEFFFRACGYRLLNILTPLIVYFILMLGLSLIFTKVLSLNVLGI